MAGQGSARSIRPGFTLIEVMTALVVFSFLVGLGTQFVASGTALPFVSDRVEPWLGFLEESSTTLRKLPAHSPLWNPGVYEDPFPAISKPPALSSWKLAWVSTNLAGYRAARFSAVTRQNKTIEWYVYTRVP